MAAPPTPPQWANRRQTAFAALLPLAFVGTVCAQTAQERADISASSNRDALVRIEAQHRLLAEVDAQRVRDYLQRNPEMQKRLTLDGGQVRQLIRIDDDGNPVFVTIKGTASVSTTSPNGLKSNLASGQLIKADSLYPGGSIGASVTGQNMVAGIWDGGQVRATHDLLSGQVTMQPSQTVTSAGGDEHMTHVTGTIVGKDGKTPGNTNVLNDARGIAYGATSMNYDWSADKAEMAAFAGSGYLVSNHSYGYPNDSSNPVWQFGAYDSEAKAWDVITKNAPNYLPFVAGGNEQQSNGNTGKTGALQGYDVMTGASAAKNVMTVGSVNADKSMSTYSNWGPTDDGRVKPDIVTRGTSVNSSVATGDQDYKALNGTSMATPAATAAGLLLQQYYKSLWGNYMLSSTLKALMIGTAEDLGTPGPDAQFGWGLLNVEKAANAIKHRSGVGGPAFASYSYAANISRGAVIEEITVNPTNNSTSEISRDFIAKGGEPIVATLVWTDDDGVEQTVADGTDPTASRAVYQFDMLLRQVSPFVDTRTWVTPTISSPTAAATKAADWSYDANNVKQIVFDSPAAGQAIRLYFRKSSASPAAARTISLVVTGVQAAGYVVTTNAGANGALLCGSPGAPSTLVTANASTTCAASPANGYRTVSISGCSGTATAVGVNSFTTGAVTADCTVTATFELAPAVNGACGTAAGVPSLSVPSANLCAAGTQSVVSTNANGLTYGWSCSGANGGTTASCSAPRQHTVTASAGADGTLACGSPAASSTTVTGGSTTSCVATPAAGYRTATIVGCGGTATTAGVDNYATGAILGACTVTATFELQPRGVISVSGNGLVIANGDSTPNSVDNTDFGGVFLGGTQSKAFVITNTGTGNLTVSSISIGGPAASDYVVTQPAAYPVVVTPGNSSTVTVRFAPSAVGARTATLTINADDGVVLKSLQTYGFALSGVGSAVITNVPVPVNAPLALLLLALAMAGFVVSYAARHRPHGRP